MTKGCANNPWQTSDESFRLDARRNASAMQGWLPEVPQAGRKEKASLSKVLKREAQHEGVYVPGTNSSLSPEEASQTCKALWYVQRLSKTEISTGSEPDLSLAMGDSKVAFRARATTVHGKLRNILGRPKSTSEEQGQDASRRGGSADRSQAIGVSAPSGSGQCFDGGEVVPPPA